VLIIVPSECSDDSFQALEFLSSHSATIVILLKNEMDYVPLALLEEIHLIVTLCGSVLPSVPKSELVRLLHSLPLRC
jgi:nuclear pore complex protein Nup205